MKTLSAHFLISAILLPLWIGACTPQKSTSTTTTASVSPDAQAQTRAIAAAAAAYLDSLDPSQRAQAQFVFVAPPTATKATFARKPFGGAHPPGPPPGAETHDNPGPPPDGKGPPHGPGMGPMGGFIGEQYGQAVWSNFPVSDVPRPGLQLGSLNPTQRAAAMHLLQAALSAAGYQKVLGIMGADQMLSKTEQGSHFAAGNDVYTLAILGMPSATAPWMLEFGGHHLGLNLVFNGEHAAMTPTLTGTQPSVYQIDGKTVRPLAGENDTAFALLDALDTDQRNKALLTYRVDDLVLGPGHAGETIVPEGLPGTDMTATQKALLLNVIAQWAGIANDAYAKSRLADIKAGLDATYFAWSGPTTHAPEKNGSAYYRIQGPKVIIEFAPQGTGGDATMHVHTMYRDPTNDYGVADATR
ncbi:MAG: DUF3500 domain-containing protein [Burkholderiaceae bacterium]